MAIQILKTEKGNDMHSYNDYIFVKEKENDIKSVWKCNQYFKNKCRGRVHLINGKMLKSSDHNRVPNSTDTLVKKNIKYTKRNGY